MSDGAVRFMSSLRARPSPCSTFHCLESHHLPLYCGVCILAPYFARHVLVPVLYDFEPESFTASFPLRTTLVA